MIVRDKKIIMSWQGAVEKFDKFEESVRKYDSLYSPAEIANINSHRKEMEGRYKDDVVSGVCKEFKSYADKVIQAEKLCKKAEQSEINSWEPDKLNSEITLALAIIRGAIKEDPEGISGRVKKAVSEANKSKDKYKIRAMSVALKGAGRRLPEQDDRFNIKAYASDQKSAVADIRMTETMIEANKVYELASEAITNIIPELNRANRLVGMGDALEVHASNNLSQVIKEFKERNVKKDKKPMRMKTLNPANYKGEGVVE